MTRFITHVHKDLRTTRLTKRGATHKAEDVPRGVHKEYARMEQFILPEPEMLDMPLVNALLNRRSYRRGSTEGTVTLQDWGTLLGMALKRRADSLSRNYPSGGALYPIETYVASSAFPDLAPTVFHYNPTAHVLEKLWSIPHEVDLKDLAKKPDDLLFSTVVIFTSVWKRSSAKYGDFTYTVALLEAGHMSENILLAATALGLQSRPMAGFDDQKISKLLDLNEENEQPVHTVVLSK
jgi:SagB-type dehydrogenase family enzyme